MTRLTFALLLAASPPPVAPWPAGAQRVDVHMIGHAHVDPVWLWPRSEGRAVVLSTFRSALDRIAETPAFTFTASSAQFFEWIAETDPGLMAQVRRRVREGRIEPVGGFWVEADMNMPSGEALVRQGLYGQRTLQRLLGQRARVGFSPDAFGHPATAPQILRGLGLDAYVMMRPQPHEKSLPAPLFRWQAPDGTAVPTYRIPVAYAINETSVRTRLLTVLNENPTPATPLMVFYGVGDHGGGPTRALISSVLDVSREPGAPRLRFGATDRYFAAVGSAVIPTVEGELQHHAVGTYTANGAIKAANRRTEALLVTAEALAAVGDFAAKVRYPAADLERAWKRLLFNQFHDILAGTAIPEHDEAVAEDLGLARSLARQAIEAATQAIAWQVPALDPESDYLVVWNPHPWAATLPIEYDIGFLAPWDPASRTLEIDGGAPVPGQVTAASSIAFERRKLVFDAPMPPLGYRQFRLRSGRPAPVQRPARGADRSIDNGLLRLTISARGRVELSEAGSARPLTAPEGIRVLVLDDPSDTWGHGVQRFDRELGVFAVTQSRVVESGPVRARLRTVSSYGASTLMVDWTLWAGRREVQLEVFLDLHERHRMVKLAVPVPVTRPRATHEIAFGHVVRDSTGLEHPTHRWVDVSGQGTLGAEGLTLINDAKYGASVHGGELRLSLARTALYAHHAPRPAMREDPLRYQDQGPQRFRAVLVPHTGDLSPGVAVRRADELLAPVPVVYQGIHGGVRPVEASFLSVDAQNVVVTAFKRAEDGRGWVVRLRETEGRPARGLLSGALTGAGRPFRLRAYELQTLRILPGRRDPIATNLLEDER